MKRLFRIGIGIFINSIIPISSWIVLSWVLKDERISNLFSITYSIQFVFLIIKYLFATGANIKKEKEHDKNATWNGIFWGTIFSIISLVVVLFVVDDYIVFFGQDKNFYRPYIAYAFAYMFLQTLFSLVMEKLYFEDKEKVANNHILIFNIASFVLLIALAIAIPNIYIALSVCFCLLLIYVICIFIWQFEKFKIKFDFVSCFRYESADVVFCFLMFITFLFGFKTAFNYGEKYLLAINLVGLCTDAQWDMLTAIGTVAKIDLSKNRFNYKNQLKNAHIFAGVVIFSSVIMTLTLSFINHAVMYIVIISLSTQICDMILYPYKAIMSTFTQLEHSPTKNTIIKLLVNALRTLLSVVIISPFCTDIAQVAGAIIEILIFAFIRAKLYKIDNDNLILKKTKTETYN